MTEGKRDPSTQELFRFLVGASPNHNSSHLKLSELDMRQELLVSIAFESDSVRAKKHDSFAAALAEHEERLSELLAADERELEEKRTAFAEMLEDARGEFKELSEAEARAADARMVQWSNTHDDFVEQLKTQTAVKLWANRRKAHLMRYKSFRYWSILVGVFGLVCSVFWLFVGYRVASHYFMDDETARLAIYTASSIAVFTLLIWTLRVLVRSMISEDHLATDASARSALAHTYLALIKEEAASADDRAIVLAALFAPVSDGLVKDDGTPAFTPTSLLIESLSR